MSRIDKALDNLLVTSRGEINARLKEVSFNIPITGTESVGYCHCLRTDANGNLRLRDLVEFIDEKVVEYAIPKKEIDEANAYFEETGSPSKFARLRKKAKSLFTDLEKTGEGGELLLYILVQEFLKIPQLISKMPLKTSSKLHYQGADGIHAKYNTASETLDLYWGESKMYASMTSAMDECLKSLKDFLLDPLSYQSVSERDLQLITSNLSENVNDPELEDLLTRYFDRDDGLSNNVSYKGLCFIGFDSDLYPENPTSDITEDLKKSFALKVEGWHSTLATKISSHDKLQFKEIHFFLMPFKSVADFRKYYLEEIRQC